MARGLRDTRRLDDSTNLKLDDAFTRLLGEGGRGRGGLSGRRKGAASLQQGKGTPTTRNARTKYLHYTYTFDSYSAGAHRVLVDRRGQADGGRALAGRVDGTRRGFLDVPGSGVGMGGDGRGGGVDGRGGGVDRRGWAWIGVDRCECERTVDWPSSRVPKGAGVKGRGGIEGGVKGRGVNARGVMGRLQGRLLHVPEGCGAGGDGVGVDGTCVEGRL
jgi:hypothetical protein